MFARARGPVYLNFSDAHARPQSDSETGIALAPLHVLSALLDEANAPSFAIDSDGRISEMNLRTAEVVA